MDLVSIFTRPNQKLVSSTFARCTETRGSAAATNVRLAPRHSTAFNRSHCHQQPASWSALTYNAPYATCPTRPLHYLMPHIRHQRHRQDSRGHRPKSPFDFAAVTDSGKIAFVGETSHHQLALIWTRVLSAASRSLCWGSCKKSNMRLSGRSWRMRVLALESIRSWTFYVRGLRVSSVLDLPRRTIVSRIALVVPRNRSVIWLSHDLLLIRPSWDWIGLWWYSVRQRGVNHQAELRFLFFMDTGHMQKSYERIVARKMFRSGFASHNMGRWQVRRTNPRNWIIRFFRLR